MRATRPPRSDSVDAMQMSSHGWTDGFLVWGGSVTTSEAVDFGKSDLEIFATHACNLLEHSSSNSVGRWIPAFDRLHYLLGFHNSSYSGLTRYARLKATRVDMHTQMYNERITMPTPICATSLTLILALGLTVLRS